MSLINLLFAPWVVAARMPKLYAEATDSSTRNIESGRMVVEKYEATVSGLFAAQRSLMASGHDAMRASLRGDAASAGLAMLRAGPRAAEASLGPAAKTVSANLKRLSRRA
jgi:hypothetical protein